MQHEDNSLPAPMEGVVERMPALVFNGVEVRVRGETVCLTDMWKAKGSPEGKRPDDWKKDAAHVEFIDHVALVLNALPEGIWKGKRGNGGATFAHWHIALAYAKWFDHDFHMACNQLIRARMEGRSGRSVVPTDTLEQIDRTFGIVRMLAHKVTELQKTFSAIDEIVDARIATDPRAAVLNYVSVNQILADEFKVPPKGRRSIRQKVFRRLQDHCLSTGIKAFKSAHSGTWLFPPHEAIAFVKERCGSLIAEHMARLKGQGVLHFPNKSR